MMHIIQTIHFIRPLWFFAFIPLFVLLFCVHARQYKAPDWHQVCDTHLLPYLLVGNPKTGSRVPLALLAAGWFFAVFALSGPAWHRLPQPVYQKNTATVIVLDLSQAMTQEDIQPSRMIRARYKLLNILAQQKEGETALIVFAGEPYLAAPLTNDTHTISEIVSDLSPTVMPVPGSNLAAALQFAGKSLQEANKEKGHVIIITANPADEAAIEEARHLARTGTTISVLGMLPQGQDKSLSLLAKESHGLYVPFTYTRDDLNALLLTQTSQASFTANKDKHTSAAWEDEGAWFIWPLLLIALFGFRRGWLGGER